MHAVLYMYGKKHVKKVSRKSTHNEFLSLSWVEKGGVQYEHHNRRS